ncbi:hypothetical protein FRB99_008127 [Tulasnella sp. 403]|nr:hypothetical protein FRB99_008127 [Tulasnella sp. 403]
MKLTLRPEWRPRALSSCLGFIELKIGVKIAILFAVLNKVAGVYGLIAVFTGGSLAQLSMYIYSVIGLAAYTWGFKAVSSEDPEKSLITAHFFLVDHLLNTIWLTFFAVSWWIYNPHDGVRPVNSAAQQGVADVGPGHGLPMTDAERYAAAQSIWNKEKGTAAMLLFAYFAALLYSYAIHLRKGSYRSLPLTVAANRADSTVDDYTYEPMFENDLDRYGNDMELGYDTRRPSSTPRDIDFDAELEGEGGEDPERGRIRGRGAGPSVGGFGEMVSATTGYPNGHVDRFGKVVNGNTTPRHHRLPSKPIVPPSPRAGTRASQAQQNISPDKGKSRVIQEQLERSGEVDKWDDDDDASSRRGSRPRSPIPPTRSPSSNKSSPRGDERAFRR